MPRVVSMLTLLLAIAACGRAPAIDTAPDARSALVNGAVGLQLVALEGQSNVSGRGDWRTLSDKSLAQPYAPVVFKDRVALTNDNALTWSIYADGPLAPRPGSTSVNMGPEIGVGHALDASLPGVWGEVKIAVGSSDLAVDWNPTGTYPGNQERLFDQASDFERDGELELGGTIVADVWGQGEADGLDAAKAAAYQANLTAFIQAKRAIRPGLPFVINELSSQATVITYGAQIRAAQEAVAATVPGVVLVNCDDCEMQADLEHYSADGYVELGKRDAAAVLGVVGP